MSQQPLHLNALNENRIGFLRELCRTAGSNADERDRMRGILRKAVNGSLTESQRYCLTEYYGGTPQKLIAAHLGVSRSTVCRHIQAAEKKLRRIASYYL